LISAKFQNLSKPETGVRVTRQPNINSYEQLRLSVRVIQKAELSAAQPPYNSPQSHEDHEETKTFNPQITPINAD
jgi:hypothetical protein